MSFNYYSQKLGTCRVIECINETHSPDKTENSNAELQGMITQYMYNTIQYNTI